MKLIMHVLKESKKLGINNEALTFKQISSKLTEEFTEVVEAIAKYNIDRTFKNLKDIIGETFDLIQICILILWRCDIIAKGIEIPNLIQEVNFEHKDKLIGEREWIPQTGIEIDVKE